MFRRLAIFTACPLVVLACVSSDDSNPTLPDVDAGFVFDGGGKLDAGSVDATLNDAGQADTSAPVDAGADASLPVTLVVTKAGQPESGVTVVFHAPDGTFVDSVVTGADGKATHVVASGGQVTALFGTPAHANIVTLVGVQPGDILNAVDSSADDYPSPPEVSVTAIPQGGPSEPNFYSVNVGVCQTTFTAGQLPATFPLYRPSCARDGKFPVLILAEGNTELGFTAKKQNAMAADGGVSNVDLSAGTWSTTQPTFTVQTSNAPTTTQQARVSYSEVADGVVFPTTMTFDPSLDAGVQSSAFIVHPGYPDSIQYEGTLRTATNNGVSLTGIGTRAAAAPDGGAVSVDMAQLLPSIATATLDSTAPPRLVANWTTAAPIVGADGAFVRVDWYTLDDAGANSSNHWTVVVPPSATSATLPDLGAALAPWAPTANSTFFAFPVVAVMEASFVADYDSLRPLAATIPPSDTLVQDAYGPIAPALPVDGTIKLSAFTNNGD